MSIKLSSRHEWVKQSELRAMSVACEKVDGINLSQGVCDLAVPETVVNAAKRAIDSGDNSYSRHDGTGALRRALAEKYRSRAIWMSMPKQMSWLLPALLERCTVPALRYLKPAMK